MSSLREAPPQRDITMSSRSIRMHSRYCGGPSNPPARSHFSQISSPVISSWTISSWEQTSGEPHPTPSPCYVAFTLFHIYKLFVNAFRLELTLWQVFHVFVFFFFASVRNFSLICSGRHRHKSWRYSVTFHFKAVE